MFSIIQGERTAFFGKWTKKIKNLRHTSEIRLQKMGKENRIEKKEKKIQALHPEPILYEIALDQFPV